MKFSIVIPTIPSHHRFLPKLVLHLVSRESFILEILIISSSTSSEQLAKLKRKISYVDSLPPIKILSTTEKRTAGENRNFGWDSASAEYVMFTDADDWYTNDRTRIIGEVIEATNADLVLHNYWKLKPKFFLNQKVALDMSNWLGSKELVAATWEGTARNIDNELGIRGDTNVIARDRHGKSWPIQHGHVTIRRQVDIRFLNRYGEDGIIVRDALERGLKVLYIPNKLSIYNQISLYFIIRSTYRHFKSLFQVN